MTTKGGWTIIQKRQSNSNFARNWNEYKAGFGEVTGNYWIGNDALHYLTTRDNFLRIQLKPFGDTTIQAEYRNFRVSDESENFRMTYEKYEGSSAVDALGGTLVQFQAKNMPFSTIDRDNDEYSGSCADEMRGGWWYNSCSTSNLNGIYCENGQNCMTWKTNEKSLYGHKETIHCKIHYIETLSRPGRGFELTTSRTYMLLAVSGHEGDELDEDGGPSSSKRSKFGSAANADCRAARTHQQSTKRILLSELDERIFTYVSNSNSFSFAKFGFLKLGPLCNASESHSFTEANCHVKTVRNENNLALILEFSQLFSRGVMLLSDVKNNRRELDRQEIAAIKILDNFFKEKVLN
eukprot:XP_019925150.1 PREDICTED: uncharacterized protein LOC105333851 [Crassostrea gigas]